MFVVGDPVRRLQSLTTWYAYHNDDDDGDDGDDDGDDDGNVVRTP